MTENVGWDHGEPSGQPVPLDQVDMVLVMRPPAAQLMTAFHRKTRALCHAGPAAKPALTTSETGFAAAVGGGADIRRR